MRKTRVFIGKYAGLDLRVGNGCRAEFRAFPRLKCHILSYALGVPQVLRCADNQQTQFLRQPEAGLLVEILNHLGSIRKQTSLPSLD